MSQKADFLSAASPRPLYTLYLIPYTLDSLTNRKQYVPTEQIHYTTYKLLTLLITFFERCDTDAEYFIIIK